MRRKYKYAFTRKEETQGGFAAIVFAALSLFLFFISAILSFAFKGHAGNWIGVFGLMAILFSGYGFFIGIRSFQEKDKSYHLSMLGSLASGLIFVGWLALFLLGV